MCILPHRPRWHKPILMLASCPARQSDLEAKTLSLQGIVSCTKVNYVAVMQYVRSHSPDNQSLSAQNGSTHPPPPPHNPFHYFATQDLCKDCTDKVTIPWLYLQLLINYGNFESSPSPGGFLKVSLTKQARIPKYTGSRLLANDTHELCLDSLILSYTLYNASHSWLIDWRLSWTGALWKEHYESSHNWALKSQINIISLTNFTVLQVTCLWSDNACILQSLLFGHRYYLGNMF